jgi:hypothetical protein
MKRMCVSVPIARLKASRDHRLARATIVLSVARAFPASVIEAFRLYASA